MPKSIHLRIGEKVRVGTKSGLTLRIPYWLTRPTSEWPKRIQTMPWIWTGAVSEPRLGMREKSGQMYVNEVQPRPLMKVDGRYPSIPRLLYEMVVGPAATRLRYHTAQANSLDVNPLHWSPQAPKGYPYTDADFALFEETAPDNELVQQLEEEFSLKPFLTWDDFHARFADIWFDVPKEDQIAALEAANLLHRLS